MPSSRRRVIEREAEVAERDRRRLGLWVLVAISGLAGLLGALLLRREPPWPRPLAFGWFALSVVALVAELRRRRRARPTSRASRSAPDR